MQRYLLDLISPEPQLEWRLPDWLLQQKSYILDHLHDISALKRYTLYHDCGKPRCRTVDSDGRVHFPDHARISREIYLQHFDDKLIANLIGWDMAIHTSTATEIDCLLRSEWTQQDAFSLLLTAFAEIHSNAAMFGGMDSTSFKIKWKRAVQRGKQILRFFSEKD